MKRNIRKVRFIKKACFYEVEFKLKVRCLYIVYIVYICLYVLYIVKVAEWPKKPHMYRHSVSTWRITILLVETKSIQMLVTFLLQKAHLI